LIDSSSPTVLLHGIAAASASCHKEKNIIIYTYIAVKNSLDKHIIQGILDGKRELVE